MFLLFSEHTQGRFTILKSAILEDQSCQKQLMAIIAIFDCVVPFGILTNNWRIRWKA